VVERKGGMDTHNHTPCYRRSVCVSKWTEFIGVRLQNLAEIGTKNGGQVRMGSAGGIDDG